MATQEELLIAIRADISNFSSQMDKINDQMKKTGQEGDSSGEKVGGMFGRMSGLAIAAAGAVVGVVAAIGSVAKASIEANMEYEKAMNKMQASTGATKEQTKEMGKVVLDVYKKGWGESIEQISADMGKLKSVLGTVDDKTLESAEILQSTFETADIDSTARAVKNMTANFPGLTQQKAMDLITTGFQKTGDASGDLLDTFNEYSPYFASMGISAEEFTNMLIKGSKDGAFNLDKVADAVKEFNIRAKDGSKSTSEAFEALGMDADKMGQAIAKGGEGGKKAFNETLAALNKITDPVKKNEIGVKLFGTQFEDLEAKAISSLTTGTEQLGEFEGSTKKAGDAMQQGLSSNWTKLKRQFSTALIGEDSPIYKGLNKLTVFFIEMMPKFSEITKKVMDGVKAVFEGLDLSGIIGGISSALGSMGELMGAIFGDVLQTALKFIVESFQSMGDRIEWAFGILKEVLEPITSDVLPFFTEQLNKIKKWWEEDGEMIRKAAENVFGFIRTIVETCFAVFQKVVEFVMPLVSGIVSVGWDTIKNIFQTTIDIIMDIVSIFGALFTGDWDKLWKSVGKLISDIMDGIGRFIKDTLWGIIKALGSFIIDFMKKIGEWLGNLGSSMGDGIMNIRENMLNTLWGMVDKVKQFGSDFINWIVNGVKKDIAMIGSVGSDIYNWFKDGFNKTLSKFTKIGSEIINGIIEGLSNMKDKVVNKAKEIGSSIADGFKDFFDIHSPSRLMRGYGINIMEGVDVGMDSEKSNLVKTALNLAEEIVNPFNNAEASVNVGLNKDSYNNAINGINGTLSMTSKYQQEKEQKIEVLVRTNIDRFVDEVTTKVVESTNGLIGGRI